MQQKWGIPDSAPAHVQDALYAIMGNDCSALSDVQALANRAHEIVTVAPAEQQADLIKAFYLPNGVLKEYAQHDPGVQAIKVHGAILSNESADTRKELNELVGSRIKNNQDTASTNKAIEALNLKFTEAPQQQKPNITPQGGGGPTPGTPGPESEQKNNNLDQGKAAALGAVLIEEVGEKTTEITENAIEKGIEVVEQVKLVVSEIESRAVQNIEIERIAQYNSKFKSTVQAATKKIHVNFLEGNINHMLDNRRGHLPDTAENRNLFLDLVSDSINYFAKPDSHGNL